MRNLIFYMRKFAFWSTGSRMWTTESSADGYGRCSVWQRWFRSSEYLPMLLKFNKRWLSRIARRSVHAVLWRVGCVGSIHARLRCARGALVGAPQIREIQRVGAYRGHFFETNFYAAFYTSRQENFCFTLNIFLQFDKPTRILIFRSCSTDGDFLTKT